MIQRHTFDTLLLYENENVSRFSDLHYCTLNNLNPDTPESSQKPSIKSLSKQTKIKITSSTSKQTKINITSSINQMVIQLGGKSH